MDTNYLYKDETYQIIGASMAVHRELGNGFLEAVYQEALAIEFNKRHITFEKEKQLDIYYTSIKLNKKYFADFVCFENIIIELKAIQAYTDEHLAQVLNYLKATNYKLGILINFGAKSLQYRRVIL
jgi:GxxExxY protein